MREQTLLHAYRNLYRAALHAVQFSKPARYVARDHLRSAFRSGTATDFAPDRIARTVEFLYTAARVKGLEHKVVKNVLRVWGERVKIPFDQTHVKVLPLRKTAYVHFDRTVELLNESMGLCIK